MQVLKQGVEGEDVRKWQAFLIGQGLGPLVPSGRFDAATRSATMAFQTGHALDADGKVGNNTLGRAMTLGFELIDFAGDQDSGFPGKPGFAPLPNTEAREQVFGKFAFVSAPQPGNAEAIRITDDWESRNIVRVDIPQLRGKKGAPANGVIRFHRLGANQLKQTFEAWDRAGLMDHVLTWDGSFVPRFQRGSRTALSNHAFGSAFDLNASFNPLNAEPAFPGEKGCLFDLVAIAHQHGFYWGGHFSKRRDGMHFEVAQVK